MKIVSNRPPGRGRLDRKTDTGIEYYTVIIWNSLDAGHLSANCTKFQRNQMLNSVVVCNSLVWKWQRAAYLS